MLLAGLGCSFAVMLITDLFRKTVPALILTLAIGTGILCELISTITAFATDGDIIIKNYLLTGMFQIFGETQSSSDAVKVVLISVIYIAASLTASVFSIKKRDVI
jgi:ABC-type transport system involved in multi-copper enzyme maturation permease subunit